MNTHALNAIALGVSVPNVPLQAEARALIRSGVSKTRRQKT